MKLKIDNEQMFNEFFENTLLLGIVAPQKDYMFIWCVNQLLGYKFRSSHNVEIQLKKRDRDYFFNIYEFMEPLTQTHHLLYENQHDGEFLLPEFKHLDFIWLIRDSMMTEQEFSELQQSLKNIESVQMVNVIDHEKIKSKKNLIY